MRMHGMPYLPTEHLNLVELTISRATWPTDSLTGSFKFSFTSSIEYNFGPAAAMKAALMGQLSLKTAYGRTTNQRVLGMRMMEHILDSFVSALWDELYRDCYKHFLARYQKILARRRAGRGLDTDAENIQNMEDGLDTWSSVPDQEKLTFTYVQSYSSTRSIFVLHVTRAVAHLPIVSRCSLSSGSCSDASISLPTTRSWRRNT